ncbi:MAG: DUF368 domain-containing protein [Oscillospiraceae bacterium]|nr:DUF368 domain-containing protein [Oscillospiraceae bacterium]
MGHIINVLKGIAMGIAFVIPGFSGGTMAVILKIYDRLLNAISLNFKKLKKNIPFLLTLAVGLGIGIYATSFGLTWLFENYPTATKLTLVGIVCGSLPMIWHECTAEKKFQPVSTVPFIVALGVMIVMFFLENSGTSDVVARDFSVGLAVKLVIGGIIAAVSMIIPGISGSLMLTIMGMYQTATTSVKELNIALLIPFAAGAVIGLLAGAKCISLLLKNFRQGTYAVIIGLIVGSLLTIFPSDFRFNTEGIVGIVLLIIGFLIPILFERADKSTKNKAK